MHIQHLDCFLAPTTPIIPRNKYIKPATSNNMVVADTGLNESVSI